MPAATRATTRPSRTIRFPSQREATRGDAREDGRAQRRVSASAGTLKAYIDQWLPYHAKAKPLAPKTAERYESLAAHAIKALGTIPLKDLTPFVFDDLYVKLSENFR